MCAVTEHKQLFAKVGRARSDLGSATFNKTGSKNIPPLHTAGLSYFYIVHHQSFSDFSMSNCVVIENSLTHGHTQ